MFDIIAINWNTAGLFGAALISAATAGYATWHNGKITKQVNEKVDTVAAKVTVIETNTTTGNDKSLANLADEAEIRRLMQIPVKELTVEELEHIESVQRKTAEQLASAQRKAAAQLVASQAKVAAQLAAAQLLTAQQKKRAADEAAATAATAATE
jgi:hypothetical protein